MRVPNLAQPPCETSLMGVVQGALAHYGIKRSAGEAFVLSGHAFAIAAWEEAERFADAPYGFGPNAYAKWLSALDAGHGDDHGSWWNGRVWGECRDCAGDYFAELADAESAIPRAQAAKLAEQYHGIAQRLRLAVEREQPIAERRRAVAEARDLEADCVERIVALQCAAQP